MRYGLGGGGGVWRDWRNDLTGTSTTITGLTRNRHYWVTVMARNAAGWSAWSDDLLTGTLPEPPGPPVGLAVTPGATRLDLAWTAPVGVVSSYDVHYTSSTTVAPDADASGNNAATA